MEAGDDAKRLYEYLCLWMEDQISRETCRRIIFSDNATFSANCSMPHRYGTMLTHISECKNVWCAIGYHGQCVSDNSTENGIVNFELEITSLQCLLFSYYY